MSVAIGVESGSERVRKEILNRNYSNQLLLNVADRLHEHNIKFRTYNMIGLPSETKDELWETIELNIKMKTDFPRAGIFTPMPGTKIMDILREYSYIDCDFNYNNIPKTILSKSILSNVDHEFIQNSLFFFQSAIIFPNLSLFLRILLDINQIFFSNYGSILLFKIHRNSEKRRIIPYIQYVIANRQYK